MDGKESTSTTCASLLYELEGIWDEIGESEIERDKVRLQLEQQCLDVYRRQVESTRKVKDELLLTLAEFEAEISKLSSALGESVSVPRYEKMDGNLKHQISLLSPTLESLRSKSSKSKHQISLLSPALESLSSKSSEVEFHNAAISLDSKEIQVDELDLTNKKLGELKSRLRVLQCEKWPMIHACLSFLNSATKVGDKRAGWIIEKREEEPFQEVHDLEVIGSPIEWMLVHICKRLVQKEMETALDPDAH